MVGMKVVGKFIDACNGCMLGWDLETENGCGWGLESVGLGRGVCRTCMSEWSTLFGSGEANMPGPIDPVDPAVLGAVSRPSTDPVTLGECGF